MREAQRLLADQILCVEQTNTDSLVPGHTSYDTSPLKAPSSSTTVSILERDVNRVFKMQNPRPETGPDSVSPSILKHCADQLFLVFTDIFNTSLETCPVPTCFKTSIIIPALKKPWTAGLNVYRPIALTSVVMKSFECFVLSHLKSILTLSWTLQFAYRTNRSVDNAEDMALHFILHHMDSSANYARILWTLALLLIPSSWLCYRTSPPR